MTLYWLPIALIVVVVVIGIGVWLNRSDIGPSDDCGE